jgi:BirA family transcriptional regulator, biotin operon repressor / biotin---[acetyl-CoA-carboxylase] ligase
MPFFFLVIKLFSFFNVGLINFTKLNKFLLYKIPAKTLFLGKNVVFVPECHSTNTLALELSQQPSVPDGTIVITNNQTAGRGQRGNTWQTQPGKNLTLSVILKPAFLQVKDQFYLNIFTALAVQDAVQERAGASVSIKWPNDVLVAGRKICGILIENQIRGSQVSISVIGIGLNVNQQEFSNPNATSLASVWGHELDLETILHHLCECLEARYLQLRQASNSQLLKAYLEKLYWLNEKHVFESNNKEFEGTITGIDVRGKLLVASGDQTLTFDVKEIRYIR